MHLQFSTLIVHVLLILVAILLYIYIYEREVLGARTFLVVHQYLDIGSRHWQAGRQAGRQELRTAAATATAAAAFATAGSPTYQYSSRRLVRYY